MNKRILLIAVVAIGAIAVYTLLHRQFNKNNQPTAMAVYATSETSRSLNESLSYKDLANFLKEENGKHLFFLSDESQDTAFVSTSVLMPLLGEFEAPINMDIINVDMEDTEEVSVVNLKKALDIENYPSFVLVESNTDTKSYKVLSTFTYLRENPFTSEELKTWFFNNGIWTGPYGKN